MTAADDAGRTAARPALGGRFTFVPDLRSMIASTTYCTAEQSAAAATAIERAFVLIPRAECEDLDADVFVPAELVEDAAAWEAYRHRMVADASAESIRDGLLIISRPTVTEVDPPGHYAQVTGSRQFKLRATGWRLPDQDPPTDTGDDDG